MLTRRTAVEAANAAFDRSLLGAIKSIDANISTASGGLGVELPYRMLEFFQLTARGEVYYRVATEDGLVEIGDAALPQPAQGLVAGQPQFMYGTYFGTPVRMGSYARVLDRPLAGQSAPQRVVIQVAETLGSREQFSRDLVLQALLRDLALVTAALLLLTTAVGWALRPLERLRSEVAARAPDDLTPLSSQPIPADVRPLVDAINHHIQRTRRLAETQRRFIDDASHQLRTPLTTLTTQVGYALRESDPERLREALRALKDQLEETVRQTNQMLALARAESMTLTAEPVDLLALCSEVTRQWWREARARGIDLGLDAPAKPVVVQVQAALMKEALSNLLHNAVRYVPRGGHVTVRLACDTRWVTLAVVDDGPGIPPEELPRAGERFFRASNVSVPGSGIGLAIVRSIAERHGGHLTLSTPAASHGLVATIALPHVAATPQA